MVSSSIMLSVLFALLEGLNTVSLATAGTTVTHMIVWSANVSSLYPPRYYTNT